MTTATSSSSSASETTSLRAGDPGPSNSQNRPTYGTLKHNANMEGAEDKTPLPGYSNTSPGADKTETLSHKSPPGLSSDDEEMLAGIRDAPGATLYEKKCMVVNAEIDRMGMGRYQWCIWLLCGFGYLLDLMWAQAFGLVLSPLQQEFGFSGELTMLSPFDRKID